MEWIWYIIAALGAGIGTGLAGLSAATVMVPILIVLCPSFAGETGAYQATAIALASDILGSAVTAYTYARHKNIDLKRGWIMLVCILGMCTVGSYAAFRVGNVVLGSFTLFLTFFIGIRFLIRPDTSRKDTAARGEKLDWKGVAISLFFGLTIGFGTGFVGTGGGMMMLVVFTAFLGMELKTAVGTSTFIMTFTAHPARKMGCDAAVHRYRNGGQSAFGEICQPGQQSDRRPGNGRGADASRRLHAPAVLLAADFRHTAGRADTEMPRQADSVHHPVRPGFAADSVCDENPVLCLSAAALTSVIIAALIYPLLVLVENEKWYGRFFVQKSPGEIKRSLLMLFFMFAAVIAVACGGFGKPHIAAAAILMWGMGDASAALVGIPYGRHRIKTRYASKSWEGTLAMFAAAFLFGTIVLHFSGGLEIGRAALAAFPAAAAGAATELFSPSEWDTVTVPVVILIVLLLVTG